MNDRFNQRDAAFINRFDGQANLLFLSPARGINTEATQLQDETFLGFDEETFIAPGESNRHRLKQLIHLAIAVSK